MFGSPVQASLLKRMLTKSPDKIGGSSIINKFPVKFWRLVNSCQSGAVCWGNDGSTIRILKEKFEHDYLTGADKVFKTSSFTSFVRQLNLYGFRKIVSPVIINEHGHKLNTSLLEYKHPHFLKGHPEQLQRIHRATKSKTKRRKGGFFVKGEFNAGFKRKILETACSSDVELVCKKAKERKPGASPVLKDRSNLPQKESASSSASCSSDSVIATGSVLVKIQLPDLHQRSPRQQAVNSMPTQQQSSDPKPPVWICLPQFSNNEQTKNGRLYASVSNPTDATASTTRINSGPLPVPQVNSVANRVESYASCGLSHNSLVFMEGTEIFQKSTNLGMAQQPVSLINTSMHMKSPISFQESQPMTINGLQLVKDNKKEKSKKLMMHRPTPKAKIAPFPGPLTPHPAAVLKVPTLNSKPILIRSKPRPVLVSTDDQTQLSATCESLASHPLLQPVRKEPYSILQTKATAKNIPDVPKVMSAGHLPSIPETTVQGLTNISSDQDILSDLSFVKLSSPLTDIDAFNPNDNLPGHLDNRTSDLKNDIYLNFNNNHVYESSSKSEDRPIHEEVIASSDSQTEPYKNVPEVGQDVMFASCDALTGPKRQLFQDNSNTTITIPVCLDSFDNDQTAIVTLETSDNGSVIGHLILPAKVHDG